jgi:HD-GYP domain-containing protein (c-di-GMP phosphodiesterase class II)
VLCQELADADYGPAGPPANDLERKFYGFWTFEVNLVQEAIDLAIAHLQPDNPALANQLSSQVEAIAAGQTVARDDLGPIVARVVDYLQEIHITPPASPTPVSFVKDENQLDTNLVSNEVQAFLRMAQLTDQADARNPNAAAEVAALAEAMGQLLDLPIWQMSRLRLAGLLHRLAPLQQTESVLTPGTGRYASDSPDQSPSCPLIPGAQVVRTMPRLRAIATIITHQTEHWDGSGQPGGLAGDEIPLESRILGLVEAFQQRLAHLRSTVTALSPEECMAKALADCQQEQNHRWDPKLVETLSLLVCGLQQGLNLSVSVPKISAGLWLIDSHCADDLFEQVDGG